MSEELWLPVVGYEGLYIVSSFGRVATLPRWVRCKDGSRRQVKGMMRRTFVDHTSHGYRCVGLTRDGIAKKCGVHILVLEAFQGPRPPGMEACHNDGDRTNARLDNLRWDTKKANQADKVLHGTAARGERQGSAKMTLELVQWVRESPQSSLALAPILGLAPSTIRAVRLGQNWRWAA